MPRYIMLALVDRVGVVGLAGVVGVVKLVDLATRVHEIPTSLTRLTHRPKKEHAWQSVRQMPIGKGR
jgi:hypothetical protein